MGDLWDEKNERFMSYKQFRQRYGDSVSWILYQGMIDAIPKSWKNAIKNNIKDLKEDPSYELQYDRLLDKCTATIYKTLITNEQAMRDVYEKWVQKVGNTMISYEAYLQYFQETHHLTPSPKFRSFQFWLLHRKIFLNKILKIWGLTSSDQCTYCGDDYETIEHFFVDCSYTTRFWTAFSNWFECLTNTEIQLTKVGILFNNYKGIDYCDSLNMFILLAKQFVFSQRCLGKEELGFYTFRHKLKEIMKIEHREAVRKNTKAGNRHFLRRWGVLM